MRWLLQEGRGRHRHRRCRAIGIGIGIGHRKGSKINLKLTVGSARSVVSVSTVSSVHSVASLASALRVAELWLWLWDKNRYLFLCSLSCVCCVDSFTERWHNTEPTEPTVVPSVMKNILLLSSLFLFENKEKVLAHIWPEIGIDSIETIEQIFKIIGKRFSKCIL